MAPPGDDGEIIESLVGLDEVSRPIHNQRILEARVTFWCAIVLLATGSLLLIFGALGGTSELPVAKAVAGALLNVIGTFVLRLYKNVNAKLDRFRRDRDAMHMILQIADKHARDRAIQEFSKYLQDEKVSWWKRLFRR